MVGLDVMGRGSAFLSMALERICLKAPLALPYGTQAAIKSRCAPLGIVPAKIKIRTGALSPIVASKNITTNTSKSATGLVLPAEDTHVKVAAAALKNSEVIAVPTDTLYGFSCDACSELAVRKIYNIKGRSATRPVAICVADVQDIQLYATIDHLPKGLLAALFPGPVTLILPRGDSSLLDHSLNPGLTSIGVRIPDGSFIRSLCRAFGGALALTSANFSSHPSTVSIEEFKHLWEHCSFVFDAGRLPAGRAGSTIVDLTLPGTFKVVRDGSALEETQEVLNKFGVSERDEGKVLPA